MNGNDIIFEREVIPGISQCDINGTWKLSSILEALQDTAHEHCRLLHLSRNDLEKLGLSWVIFKIELQMQRYPKIDEPVTIQTFTQDSTFKFFPRYYLVLDKKRIPICKAGALWMVVDKGTKRAVSSKSCGIVFPNEKAVDIPIKISTTTKIIKGDIKTKRYKPSYNDFDINAHVNNIRYVDWLCNDLGIHTMTEKEVSFISINYFYEVPVEADLQTSMTIRNDEFLFTGCGETKRFFSIFGTLRQREI